jgi:multiple sugar transport system substrate-binding protein
MLRWSNGARATRLAAALVIGLPLAAIAAAPGHGTRAPISLTIAGCWTNKDQDAAFTKVATGFNKVQSAIKVKVIEIGDAAKVLTQVSAGNPPDVYFDCSVSDLGQWAANGYVLDLDPYIKAHHFDVNKLTPGARALGVYNGHTYALPLLEDMFMLLYNKKLFRQAGLDPNKPPTTAEQLLAYSDKLTKRDASGRLTQLGFNPTFQAGAFIGTWLPVFMRTFGGSLVDAKGNITANCAACVAALTWETKFYTHYGASNVDRLLSSAGSTADLFESGKIAMEINGEWTPFFVEREAPKGFDYAVAPLPHPASRPDLANYGMAGGNPGTIMKGTKNPDAAFTFLAYMQTVGPTVAYANAILNVPQLKAAINSPALNPNPIYRAFVRYAQGPGIGSFPVTPVSSNLANSLTTVEQLVLHGKMTPKQGLDKVTHDLQAQLNQGI